MIQKYHSKSSLKNSRELSLPAVLQSGRGDEHQAEPAGQPGSCSMTPQNWLRLKCLSRDTNQFFGVEHGVGSGLAHKLQTPSEEIAFTAQPKIKSQSQILSYSQSMFCLPHRPKISNFFDLCLHCTGCPYSMVWRACLKYSAAPLNSVLCGISHAKKLVFSATELNMQKPIRPN